MDIIIDEEFEKLIPKITQQERSDLKESILAEGCTDPLVVWGNILVDGHTRYKICIRHNIPFKTRNILLDTRESAKLWIITNQLARRNLTLEQMKYLRGAKQILVSGQQHNCQDDSSKTDKPKKRNVAKELAKEYGVSESTIYRDARFAKQVDKMPEEEKQKVLSGEKKVATKPPKTERTEKKDSFNLEQLKYYWSKSRKADKNLFVVWANLMWRK